LTRMSPSKGNDGQRVKSGSGAAFSGTTLTLVQVKAHCPGSISEGRTDAGWAVLRTPTMLTMITVRGRCATAKVIHRSYPQARQFHVKHDVERVHALWIHEWTDPHSKVSVSRETGPRGFSTAFAHSLWIVPVSASGASRQPIELAVLRP